MKTPPRLIVITGGPGAGKTTLVARLAEAGFRTSEEAGRRIILEEIANGGDALPWADRARFAEKMLAADIAAYEAAVAAAGPVFFDRGVPDVAGYLRVIGLPVPPHVYAAARRLRYEKQVFLAPFWPEIFSNDAERKQSPDEARRTGETMAETYRDYGYEVVDLPLASVEERIAFILARTAG